MIHFCNLKTVFSNTAIAVVFLCLSGCDRSANKDESKPQQSDQTLKKYDKDGDGQLSEKEKKTMNEKFVARFDTDGDKKLSPKERDAARKKAKVTVNAKSQAPMTLERSQAFLKRFDKDGDAMASEKEVGPDRWKVMGRADKNGDKKISAEEWLNRNSE